MLVDAPLGEPHGWSSMQTFGLWPYWPTAGSANGYNAMNPDRNVEPPIIVPGDDKAYSDWITSYVNENTYDMLALLGTAPGEWTLPVCDQGYNFWTFDWSNSGGLEFDPKTLYYPTPCACGHKGTGTEAFYKALGVDSDRLITVLSTCKNMLLNIDPSLPKKAQYLGWNAISGGKPASIVYGDGYTLTAPTADPTPLCQMVKGDCKTYGNKPVPCTHHDC